MSLPATLKRLAFALASVLLTAQSAAAQPSAAGYPDKPIHYVIPWPVGATADIVGRLVADGLSKALGQPVVIENRAGATGAIGTQHVLQQPADGYYLLQPNSTVFVGNVVASEAPVGFDPLADFVPVGIFLETPSVIWANPALGASSLEALRQAAQARATPIPYGSNGNGSVAQLAIEQLAQSLGITLLNVPYKGGAAALTDLLGGHILVGLNDLLIGLPHIQSGKLVPLAVAGRDRLPEIPAVPSFRELGIIEPDLTTWNGVFVRRGTPAPVVERLQAALRQVTSAEEFTRVVRGNGNTLVFRTGDEVDGIIREGLAARKQLLDRLNAAAATAASQPSPAVAAVGG